MRRITGPLVAIVALFITGCASLPSLEDRTATTALTDTDDTRLGSALAPLAAANSGKTGIYPLPDARDAFAARKNIPLDAYEVRLVGNDGGLEWIERTASGDKRYDTEPGVGFMRRMFVGFLSLLPIDWML